MEFAGPLDDSNRNTRTHLDVWVLSLREMAGLDAAADRYYLTFHVSAWDHKGECI